MMINFLNFDRILSSSQIRSDPNSNLYLFSLSVNFRSIKSYIQIDLGIIQGKVIMLQLQGRVGRSPRIEEPVSGMPSCFH